MTFSIFNPFLGSVAGRAVETSVASLGIVALFASPMLIVAIWLNHRRKRHRAETLEPFTEMPLRPPGETLRRKIETLSDDFDSDLGGTAVASIGAAMFAAGALSVGKPSWLVVCFLACVAFGAAAFSAWKLSRIQRELWDARLGFDGERAVGEYLTRLVADKFHVFHDVPFENFNIDHVLVGPPGVFAIETKTRRKPAELKGSPKATVVFDGTKLIFPRGNFDSDGLAQAERNAATLAKFLTAATGEATRVKAILTLPGWWIDRKAKGTVNVLNPKEIQYSFRTTDAELPPDRIQRLVHQLNQVCRIEKTP